MIKPQFFKFVLTGLLFLVVFGFGQVGSAQAQATFQVSGTSTPITRIGHVELIGSVTFTVVAGTTQTGTIEFFLPNVPITNDVGSGIGISGTGGLAGATIAAVIPANGIVIINVPSGAVTGSSVTLSGVRISAVGKTFNTLDASISTAGNSVFAGQNFARVVHQISDGLTVDATSQTIVTVANNVVVTAPGAIVVTEGWERSFSSAVGVAGQTAKTQVIFQVLGLPDNVSLTFPAFVTSPSGATLVTLSAAAETITNQSTPLRVVYEFNDGGSSTAAIDSFSITPTIDLLASPGTGTAIVQVALGPIGAAVPDQTFPSTSVPRFSEVFLPPLSSIPVPIPQTFTQRLAVPGSIDDEAITLSNTTSGGAVATVRARRENGELAQGSNVTNTTTVNLPAKQTLTFSLTELFGVGASVAGISSIDVESQNTGLVLNSIARIGSRRFANGKIPEAGQSLLPLDRRTSADIPQLTVHNTSNTDAALTISLRSSAGAAIASVERVVPSLGTLRESLSGLFAPGTIPLEGYVVVRSSGAVRSLLVNNPTSRPDGVPTSLFVANSPTFLPFFVFGGGYSTVLEVINTSDTRDVRVLLNAYSTTGSALSAQPLVRTLVPNQRQNFDFASAFGTGGSGSTVGYFSVTLEHATPANPFSSPPQVVGIVRIGTDTTTAVLPLYLDAGNQFYLTPAVENSTAYTGLAILNSTASPTEVTVEAFANSGATIGSSTFVLSSNNARVQLLRELVPQTVGRDNILVRVTSSTAGIKLIGFRGSLNSDELIYLKGETLP